MWVTTIQVREKNFPRTLPAQALPPDKQSLATLLNFLVLFAFLYSFTTSVYSLDIIISFSLFLNFIYIE